MTDIDTFDTETMTEFKYDRDQLMGLNSRLYEDMVPGTEGFFSRVFNTIINRFRVFINSLHQQVYSWEALLTQNWKQYAERYIKQLSDNLPESEAFTGTISLRGTKAMMEKNKAAMISVVNLTRRLDAVILSSEKDTLPREMRNVITYLEMNQCKIDPSRPSESSAGTRFAYGELGRLGTAGYGSEPSLFISAMSRGLNDWYTIFSSLSDTKFMDQAVRRMEAEINKRASMAEKAKDRQKLELSEQINNMKARMVAYRAILRATIDMWNTTLVAHFILPLQNLGLKAGVKDDLFTWILATKED